MTTRNGSHWSFISPGTRGGFVVALVLAAWLAACGGTPSPSVQGMCNPLAAASAASVPPGTPVENASSATEWPL